MLLCVIPRVNTILENAKECTVTPCSIDFDKYLFTARLLLKISAAGRA